MHGRDALFPEYGQLVDVENRLTERLGKARRNCANRNATASFPTPGWLDELKSKQFNDPEGLEPLMEWVIDALDTGIVQMTHPGCLGLFNPSPTFAAECGDRIASAFNPQICVYSHAPAAVEIEQHVINVVAHRVGLADGAGGHFTSGGAEANATAVLCALQAKCPDYGDRGLSQFDGQPTVYVSNESHLAWLKIAHSTGIGRKAVRLVATDGMGQMDADQLEARINEDTKGGCVPVLIAATAGTTNAGMIDPLKPCHALAQSNDMWFHVDAAWGGALIASPESQSVLDGIEQADSVTIDAHKWFATTMGSGMFLTSRPDIPAQVFRVSASYMPESETSKDFYVNSNQWSRRFVGLRLFLALGSAGWEGYAEHVNRSVRLSKRLATNLIKHGWTQVNDSPMAVICMVPPEGPDAVQNYVERTCKDGRFWISKAIFEGDPVVRACITNGRTDEKVIDRLSEILTTAK